MKYRLLYQGVYLGEVDGEDSPASKRASGNFVAVQPLPPPVQAYVTHNIQGELITDDAEFDRHEREEEALFKELVESEDWALEEASGNRHRIGIPVFGGNGSRIYWHSVRTRSVGLDGSTREEPGRLTYSTHRTAGIRTAFGLLVFLGAGIPTAIVALQWLAPTAGRAPLTDPWAIVPGTLIMMWGAWAAAARERVTVDEYARTLRWTRSIFRLTLSTTVWQREDIETIRVHENNAGLRSGGYGADVTGAKGTRELLDYFHSPHPLPEELRETSRLLGMTIQGVD